MEFDAEILTKSFFLLLTRFKLPHAIYYDIVKIFANQKKPRTNNIAWKVLKD